MKKILLIFSLLSTLALSISLYGCLGYVKCAWVALDMDGYILYTTNMYSSGGNHIYLYESEEDALDDHYHAAYMLSIVFYPRIMGPDTINGIKTTTVDIGSKYTMDVHINKNSSIYAQEKLVYLNDEALTYTNKYDYDTLLCLSFENFKFVQGNPKGKINNFINLVAYK